MAENRDAEVDPRFDPMFQRGYDPAVHGGGRVRPAPRHATGPVPVDAVRQAAFEDAVIPPDPAPAPAAVIRVVPPPAEDVVLRARNPFRLALLLASVAAIGGAAWIMWNQLSDPYRYGPINTDTGAQFLQQFTDAMLVPLLTAGLIGLTLWLAIGALQRRDAPERADEDAET